MLIRKETRSIPWTCEYRFEWAIPPLPSAYLASRLSGHFSGDLLKLYFFSNEATPGFLTVNRKSTRLWSILFTIFERKKKKKQFDQIFFYFFFFLQLKLDSFLNFSRYILRNVQTLYFIFEIFHFFFEHFSNTFFSPFYAHFSRLFFVSSLYIYFFFLSKCFYFPRLQSFRTLYVSVLISNLYFFLLIFRYRYF